MGPSADCPVSVGVLRLAAVAQIYEVISPGIWWTGSNETGQGGKCDPKRDQDLRKDNENAASGPGNLNS